VSRLQKGILAIVGGAAMMIGGYKLTHWGVVTVHQELELRSQGTGATTATDVQHKKRSEGYAEHVRLADAGAAREVGVWTLTWRNADGSIKDVERPHNTLSKIADQRILENYFRGGAAAGTTFYFALADTTNPCSITKTDSLATALTGEPAAGNYTRANYSLTKDSSGWVTSAASTNDWHIVSKVVTITASGGSIGPANCLVLTDVSSGTTGDWHAWVALSQARTMASGESLDVSMDITLQ
jgi:hypothetical protein